MRYYEKIEADALARNIPVMQREGLEFMIEIFKHHNCHCCLEIGSAIGYSAMMLVSNINNFFCCRFLFLFVYWFFFMMVIVHYCNLFFN